MTEAPSISSILAKKLQEDVDKRAALPPLAEFLTSRPLYEQLSVDDEFLNSLLNKSIQFDSYCPYCQRDSVFKRHSPYTGAPIKYQSNSGEYEIVVKCSRNANHVIFVFFKLATGHKIQKIGQFPSIADLTGADLVKYRSILKGEYFAELNRANGLISHGVGIGAFVYLRRIFEKLIADYCKEKETLTGSPIEQFETLRMDEKIAALSDVLPSAIVKHKAAYRILSVGIHALTEEKCKAFFPAVKSAIIQMLEQDYERREMEKKESDLEKAIAAIGAEIASLSG